jgi:hypothetical protein
LYNAASLAFGVAYNELYLVYIAYFSSSLFAFILAFTTIDMPLLGAARFAAPAAAGHRCFPGAGGTVGVRVAD